MADNRRKHGQGRFGTEMLQVQVGDRATTTLTAGGDVEFRIPVIRRKCRVESAAAHQSTVTVGTGATANSTAVLSKNVAGTLTSLSDALNLDGATAEVMQAFTIPATVTDPQRTLASGDLLSVVVSGATTVSTNPSDLYFVVELALLE